MFRIFKLTLSVNALAVSTLHVHNHIHHMPFNRFVEIIIGFTVSLYKCHNWIIYVEMQLFYSFLLKFALESESVASKQFARISVVVNWNVKFWNVSARFVVFTLRCRLTVEIQNLLLQRRAFAILPFHCGLFIVCRL